MRLHAAQSHALYNSFAAFGTCAWYILQFRERQTRKLPRPQSKSKSNRIRNVRRRRAVPIFPCGENCRRPARYLATRFCCSPTLQPPAVAVCSKDSNVMKRLNIASKASRGFEPRSLDSESRVLTVTPRDQLDTSSCSLQTAKGSATCEGAPGGPSNGVPQAW